MSVSPSVVSELESSYQSASSFSLFQGATYNGNEGGWYGFKRDAGREAGAILFTGMDGVADIQTVRAIRDYNGTWHFYKFV